ncbi:MAG: serine hydrolase [Bacteroidota bacterium]
MKKTTKLLILFALSVFIFSCEVPDPLQKLEGEIREEFAKGGGDFALAFRDLNSEAELLIDAEEKFHAASTMKTPVMIEVYKQAKAGLFKLDDSLEVKNTFYSIVDSSLYSLNSEDDSEHELYQAVGEKRSIRDLVYDMIIVSSNLATNIVIDLVDAREVTQSMRELGAMDTEVLRGVEDIKAYRAGLSNSTTAKDLMIIFKKMAKGETVDQQASSEMIETLLDQKFNDIIPVHLPKEVKVAHKTGSITALHHDSGIVFLPDGRNYVLVLLSKNLKDFDKGTETLAQVSKRIYEFMMEDAK